MSKAGRDAVRAVRRRGGKLEVSSPAGLPLGAWLQIDVGENAEYTQVLGVRGTTVKVGTVRWYHRAWWWLLARPAVAGRWARRQLCAVTGHRLTTHAGVFGVRHCWCRRRWEDGTHWDDDEDGCE